MENIKSLLARLKADVIVRKYAGDGGPGSGNWGHAGRPGKVGGSARGKGSGGKQYRGGRSDIGYFSSKRDWLNGLQGEKQSIMSKFLEGKKKELGEKLEKVKKEEAISRRGLLDPSEVRQRIRDLGMEGITENSTPEEYIMKSCSIEDKKKLLDGIGEARSWKDKAMKLQTANLTNEDLKYLAMLSMGYHVDHDGEDDLTMEEYTNYNLDRVFDNLSDEEKEFYLDMKAKACGFPDSGKKISDYSDEFQINLGAKPEPKPKKTPENDKENKTWIEMLDTKSDEFKAINEIANNTFHTGLYNFAGNPNMNEFEDTMFLIAGNKLNNDEAEPYIMDIARYLSLKDKAIKGDYYKKVASVFTDKHLYNYGRLDALHSSPLLRVLSQMSREQEDQTGNKLNVEEHGDVLETQFLMDKTIPQEIKLAYLDLKAASLGRNSTTWADSREKLIDFEIERKESIRKRKEAEVNKKRTEKYNEKRANNIVVIHGDSFSEKINSMRKPDFDYTHEEIKAIGKVAMDELQKAVDESQKRIDELEEERKRVEEEFNSNPELNHKPDESFEDWGIRRDELNKEKWAKLSEIHSKIREARQTSFAKVIKRIRKTGPVDPARMKSHIPGRSTVKQDVIDAYDNYPTEWVETSMDYGNITTKKVGRGYYSHSNYGESLVAIDNDKYETAVHELGHRFEKVIPGIAQAEKEFYDKRTEGEAPVQLRKLTGIGYGAHEYTKKDKFVNPYIGKVYSNDDSFEVVSMGFQYAYTNPKALLKDPEYAQLILGLLAVG